MCRILITPVLLLTAVAAPPQQKPSSFDTEHQRLWAANPPGYSLRLTLTGSGVYREGELIEAEVDYRTPEGPGRHPRGGSPEFFYAYRGLLLGPPQECGSLDNPCRSMGMRTSSTLDLDSMHYRQRPLVTRLNGSLPLLAPGRYRLALLAVRLELKSRGPMESVYGFTEPKQYLVSNRAELVVKPADPEWLEATIQEARETLGKQNSHTSYPERKRALEMLRFLRAETAEETALELYGKKPDRALLVGLREDPQPARACGLMETHLKKTGQLVDLHYVEIMAEICANARHPFTEALSADTPENKLRRKERILRWWREKKAVVKDGMATLAGRVEPAGPIGLSALRAVLQYGESLLNNPEPGQTMPEFVEHTVGRVRRELPGYEPALQAELLGQHWAILRSPKMIPLLVKIIVTHPEEASRTEARRMALRALAELDPRRSRKLLLAELKNFRPTLDRPTLELLPPEAVPPMDDALIDYLARWQRHEIREGPNAFLLIARYLSPGARERMQRIFESQSDPCQVEMLAYFLRADPTYAERILRREPWDMHASPGRCTLRFIEATPPLEMNPALEKFLVAYLWHEQVRVKQAAAKSLGRFGSSAAEGALWEAMRYFHEWWKDRAADLGKPEFGQNIFLEEELRDAIARGRNWLAGVPELRLLESLCLGERCQYQNKNDLRYWDYPLQLEAFVSPGSGITGSVAQYRRLQGLEEIQAKLRQFPKGTGFQLRINGPIQERERDDIARRLRQFAAKHELRVSALQ